MIGSSSTTAKHTYNPWVFSDNPSRAVAWRPSQAEAFRAAAWRPPQVEACKAVQQLRPGVCMPLPWERRLPVAHPAHPPAVQRTPALLRHRGRIPPAARLLEPQARPRQAQAWEAPPDLAGAVAAASAAVAAALAVAVAVVAAMAVAVVAALAVAAPGAVALAVAAVVAVPSAVA